ncbi:MAG: PLDc N-terminal domain-containing protein, partial [archaeon]|nr:PLDc N-terminal domain-containing protein [archaeon]
MIEEILALLLPLILIGVLGFVFWVIMLVDASQRKFKDDSEKIVWILVIVLTGIVGALIYYFVIHIKDKNKSVKWFWWTLLGLVILFFIL